MKKVLLSVFAGIGIFFVVMILLTVGLVSIGHKHERAELPDKMVLMLNLDQGIKEGNEPQGILSVIEQGRAAMPLEQVVQTLDQARLDRRVQGLAVSVREGDFGLASVQELRNAVQRFRRSGKFAYIYADTLGQKPAMAEYWLATSFDQIWLQPLGELAITGFSAEMPFGRAVLDKLGVEPELQHVGKYKSYPEMLMRTESSPENRAMTEDMLAVLTSQFVGDVSQTRHIAVQNLQHLMQDSPLSSDQAASEGLIDSIGYRDEFDSYLEQTTKGGEPVELAFYHQNGPRPVPGEKMAIINVVGVLGSQGDPGVMGETAVAAEDIVQAIQDAVDQKNIKAIVIRVDSPGGTPLAADMIRRAISLARELKPVVISMSNTAASGGYWMSVDANKIVAQPATLTGSIGVFGGKINIAQLWQKLGVNWEKMPQDGQQDLWSFNRPYSDVSRAKIQKLMQSTYNMFVTHVAKGRSMQKDRVEQLAQGRVWTGSQAMSNGLVDALGGMDVAVNLARDLAKIPTGRSINLEPFPKGLTLFEQLMQMLDGGAPLNMMGAWMQKAVTSSLQTFLQAAVPAVRA